MKVQLYPRSEPHLLLTEPWRPLWDTEPFRAREAARMRFSSGALLIGSDVGSRLTSVRSRISFASLQRGILHSHDPDESRAGLVRKRTGSALHPVGQPAGCQTEQYATGEQHKRGVCIYVVEHWTLACTLLRPDASFQAADKLWP